MNTDKVWTNEKVLIPAIIQDANTKSVLMLGYMNKDSYIKTLETKKVTFLADQDSVCGLRVKLLGIF